jgi:uncharacterized MAPEG superfamily protein
MLVHLSLLQLYICVLILLLSIYVSSYLAFEELGSQHARPLESLLQLYLCVLILVLSIYVSSYLAFEELGSPHACPLEPFAAAAAATYT